MFEKVSAKSAPGIRQEQVDRPPVGGGIKPIDSLHRGEIRFDSLNLDTYFAQLLRRLFDARLVGGHDQVVAMICAFLCEEVANAR